MMRRTPNGVTLELTEDQFASLMMAIGYATGANSASTRLMYAWLRLANEINEGNPHYTPYVIPPEFAQATDANQRESGAKPPERKGR